MRLSCNMTTLKEKKCIILYISQCTGHFHEYLLNSLIPQINKQTSTVTLNQSNNLKIYEELFLLLNMSIFIYAINIFVRRKLFGKTGDLTKEPGVFSLFSTLTRKRFAKMQSCHIPLRTRHSLTAVTRFGNIIRYISRLRTPIRRSSIDSARRFH